MDGVTWILCSFVGSSKDSLTRRRASPRNITYSPVELTLQRPGYTNSTVYNPGPPPPPSAFYSSERLNGIICRLSPRRARSCRAGHHCHYLPCHPRKPCAPAIGLAVGIRARRIGSKNPHTPAIRKVQSSGGARAKRVHAAHLGAHETTLAAMY
jgi:hypothetical protein